jgi:hypothetical protein
MGIIIENVGLRQISASHDQAEARASLNVSSDGSTGLEPYFQYFVPEPPFTLHELQSRHRDRAQLVGRSMGDPDRILSWRIRDRRWFFVRSLYLESSGIEFRTRTICAVIA